MSEARRHPPSCPHCADEIADLREEIAYLRSELGITVDRTAQFRMKQPYGLTPREALMIERMRQAYPRPVHRSVLDRIGTQPDEDEDEDRLTVYNLTSVYAWRIRRSLGQDSLVTVPAFGYALSEAGYRRVMEVLGHQVSVAPKPLRSVNG